jgi:hypothetical protein
MAEKKGRFIVNRQTNRNKIFEILGRKQPSDFLKDAVDKYAKEGARTHPLVELESFISDGVIEEIASRFPAVLQKGIPKDSVGRKKLLMRAIQSDAIFLQKNLKKFETTCRIIDWNDPTKKEDVKECIIENSPEKNKLPMRVLLESIDAEGSLVTENVSRRFDLILQKYLEGL